MNNAGNDKGVGIINSEPYREELENGNRRYKGEPDMYTDNSENRETWYSSDEEYIDAEPSI